MGCAGYLFVVVLDPSTGLEIAGFGTEETLPLLDVDGRLPLMWGSNQTGGRRYGTSDLHGQWVQLQFHFRAATLYAVGADNMVAQMEHLKTDDPTPATTSVAHATPKLGVANSNAYYAITSPAMLAAPEWPAAYRNYSLFVVFDKISVENLTAMRRDIPHAQFLIYHAYASVVTDGGRCSGCTGAACSYPIRPPSEYFEKQWAITDLRTKQPMCLGGWWPPSQRHNPQGYIPMRASADGMLRYIKEQLWDGRGWDGIYFDNLFMSFPPEYRELISNTTDQFDSARAKRVERSLLVLPP
jgi:hypothetical protein